MVWRCEHVDVCLCAKLVIIYDMNLLMIIENAID